MPISEEEQPQPTVIASHLSKTQFTVWQYLNGIWVISHPYIPAMWKGHEKTWKNHIQALKLNSLSTTSGFPCPSSPSMSALARCMHGKDGCREELLILSLKFNFFLEDANATYLPRTLWHFGNQSWLQLMFHTWWCKPRCAWYSQFLVADFWTSKNMAFQTWVIHVHCQVPFAFLNVSFSCAGWWYTYPSEKYEGQLGWWNSQPVESHNPVMFQTTNQCGMNLRTNPSNAPRAAGFPPVAAGRAEASPWMYRADLTGEFWCDFHGKMLGLTWFNHPK